MSNSSALRSPARQVVLVLATSTFAWLPQGCGPTKEDWKLAPAVDPGTIAPLTLHPDQTPATLPSTFPPAFPTSRPAARAEVTIGIDQSRQMALQNNLDLKVSLYSPKIAQTNVSQEEAKFESTFFTNAEFATSDAPPAAGNSGEPFTYNGQSNSQTVEPGVTVPLRTGGTITLASPYSRYKNPTIDPQDEADLRASISQPLLRNAGQETTEYSIRIAGYNQEISRVQSRLEVMTVLAGVERTYWRLYAARRELEVRKQQYDLAQALLERSKRLVAAGQAAEVEIVRSESGVADRVDGIINTETLVRERQRELKRVLNQSDIDDNTIIIPASSPRPIHYAINSEHLIQSAMLNRAELLQSQLKIIQDNLTVKYARNQMLPALAATYTYRIRGLGSNPSDAYDMAFQNEYDEHVVGFSLSIPIGNQAAKSQLRRALLQRLQQLSTKSAQELQIRKEVLDALDTLEANWLRIIAGRSRTLLAKRTLDAEQRQFDRGLRTATDVLDAQTKLADAQQSEISALTDYEISQIDLAFATGTLLGQAKVDWEKQIPEDIPPVPPPTTQPVAAAKE